MAVATTPGVAWANEPGAGADSSPGANAGSTGSDDTGSDSTTGAPSDDDGESSADDDDDEDSDGASNANEDEDADADADGDGDGDEDEDGEGEGEAADGDSTSTVIIVEPPVETFVPAAPVPAATPPPPVTSAPPVNFTPPADPAEPSNAPVPPPAAVPPGNDADPVATNAAPAPVASPALVNSPLQRQAVAPPVGAPDAGPGAAVSSATTFGALNATVAVVDPTAPILLPPPRVTTPPIDPIAGLFAFPGNLIAFAVDLVSAVVAPFFSPVGPSVPADTPVLWAVLAFVRRQFFNSSPSLAPTGQVADPTTGQLYGTLGVTDADGDPVQYAVLQGPAHGALVLNGSGEYVYAPDAGYVGEDSFTVAISDTGPHVHGFDGLFSPYGPHTSVYTISLTAVAVVDVENRAPTITATPGATDPATGAIRYTVTTADADGDTVTVGVSTPVNGTLVPDSANPAVYVYTPDPEYAHSLALGGSTTPGSDEIVFTATDPDGLTGTVTVMPAIAAVNANPTVALAVADSGLGDGSKLVTVTIDDADGDQVLLTFADLEHGSFVGVPNGSQGEFAAGDSFTLVYTPDPTNPGTETISFTATDAYGGTVTTTTQVMVDGTVNQAPLGVGFAAPPSGDDGSVLVSIITYDADGDSVTVTAPTVDPDDGNLAFLGSETNPADGTVAYYFAYTPSEQARVDADDTAGVDLLTLTFTISDAANPAVDVAVDVEISPLAPDVEVPDPGAVGEGDVVQILEIYRNPADGHLYATVVREVTDGDEVIYAYTVYDATTNTLIGNGPTEATLGPNSLAIALIDDSVIDADGNVYHNVVLAASGSSVFVVRPDGSSALVFSGSASTLPLALSVSPDGEHVYLKVLAPDGDEGDFTISILDLITGESRDVGTFSAASATNPLASLSVFSNAAVDVDGRVYVTDPSSGDVVIVETDGSTSTVEGLDGTPFKLAASQDGQHVYALVGTATGPSNVALTLVDLVTGDTIELPSASLSGGAAVYSDMAVSDDGTRVLLVGTGVTLVDTVAGTADQVDLAGGAASLVTDVTFSPDGTKAYVVYADGTGNIAVVSLVDEPEVPIEGQVTVADLQALVDTGAVEVSFNEDDRVRVIDGTFTDALVLDVDDAVEVLNTLAQVLGASQSFAAPELIVQQDLVGVGNGVEGEVTARFYRLTQEVNGVPALGSQVILATDGSGNVTGVFSTYDAALRSVGTVAEPDIDEASEAVAKTRELLESLVSGQADDATVQAYLAGLTFQARTVIYDVDNDIPPTLAWQVEVFTTPTPADFDADAPDPVFTNVDATFYFAANGFAKGEVLNFARPSLGASVATPQILIYRSNDLATLPGELDATSMRAQTAFNNLLRVYEYYRDVLHRNSFDGVGDGAPIRVTILPDDFRNAVQFVLAQQVGFAFGGDYEAALDVVGHEFTHAVVAYVVQTQPLVAAGGHLGLVYQDESGALNESFADIIGVLVEDELGPDRYLIGEDAGAPIRDLSNPTAYGQPDHYDDYVNLPFDNGGVHVNSGIFNHAAYMMMTDSRTAGLSTETWGRVFYGALYRLQPNAQFVDGRAAVISSAKSMGLTIEQQQAVKDAFDAVGIVDPDMLTTSWWGSPPMDSPASTFVAGGGPATILV